MELTQLYNIEQICFTRSATNTVIKDRLFNKYSIKCISISIQYQSVISLRDPSLERMLLILIYGSLLFSFVYVFAMIINYILYYILYITVL